MPSRCECQAHATPTRTTPTPSRRHRPGPSTILDVDAVRTPARATCEQDDAAAVEIDRSFAAVRNLAEAPLVGMPGVIGTPRSIEIAHVSGR